jgi:hypothetical protein
MFVDANDSFLDNDQNLGYRWITEVSLRSNGGTHKFAA